MMALEEKLSVLRCQLIAQCPTSKARVFKVTLPHYAVDTPQFMPVGTQGAMKGVAPAQLETIGCQIILANTYHLGNRPGVGVLRAAGGLHRFMGWSRGLLTDSGGFQMVSLLKLSEVSEAGVEFEDPHCPGSRSLLSPERSMDIQSAIGADVIMQLDDVVHTSVTGPRVAEAMRRSVRWLDRCVASYSADRQALFPIIQGGLDEELRAECAREMVARDAVGYAIGGLSGGEEKQLFWRVVKQCADLLPPGKPRYLMGVGYPVDLVVCAALGCDMFDCVYPTRSGRIGTALVDSGTLDLYKETYALDTNPIDRDCPCTTCRTYSRSFIRSILSETLSCHLVTIHNLTYQVRLMQRIRSSILEGRFPSFVRTFMNSNFPNNSYPEWVVDALSSVNITLEQRAELFQL